MKVNFAPILLAIVIFLTFFPVAGVAVPGGNTITITGRVVQPIAAVFTSDRTCGCRPLTVTFTDQSTGSPVAWRWEYRRTGAATWTLFSTARSPSFSFLRPWTYDIRLTVTGPGGTDMETKLEYVTVVTSTPPVDFEGSPTKGPRPLTVTFTDETACSISWRWEEKTGATTSSGSWAQFSTDNPASFTFQRPGTYSIKLTVKNACNVPASLVKSRYITVTCPAVTASMSAGPPSGTSPLTVTFTDGSSGPYTSWKLDYGDGTSTTVQNPSYTYSHTYTLPDGFTFRTYRARLTVKNDCSSSTKFIPVTVSG